MGTSAIRSQILVSCNIVSFGSHRSYCSQERLHRLPRYLAWDPIVCCPMIASESIKSTREHFFGSIRYREHSQCLSSYLIIYFRTQRAKGAVGPGDTRHTILLAMRSKLNIKFRAPHIVRPSGDRRRRARLPRLPRSFSLILRIYVEESFHSSNDHHPLTHGHAHLHPLLHQLRAWSSEHHPRHGGRAPRSTICRCPRGFISSPTEESRSNPSVCKHKPARQYAELSRNQG